MLALPLLSVPRLRRRWLWLLALLALLAPVGFEVYRVCFGANLHVVVPRQVYRCAQPSGPTLERHIVGLGIRTVVNLRGNCDPFPWYLDEARVTHKHDVALEDICFSAGRLPSVHELRRLIDVLDRAERPLLLHCRRGADRTGLAAAAVLLLEPGVPLDTALAQLAPRYGHVPIGRPAQLDEFFAYYRQWLASKGREHAPEHFRRWAREEYRPGSCWSELTFREPPPGETRATSNTVLQVRVRNASLEPWHLKPVQTAGTHLGCHVYDDHDRVVEVVKSGMRDGLVAPGETVDFTLVLPPLRKAGRYRVKLDMVDEQQCWFYQTGSEPLELELRVRD